LDAGEQEGVHDDDPDGVDLWLTQCGAESCSAATLGKAIDLYARHRRADEPDPANRYASSRSCGVELKCAHAIVDKF
jgi:hypothetical protein